MDTKDAKERKIRMEGELISIVESFEKDTDLRVTDLYLSVISEDMQGKRHMVVESTVII